MKSNEFLVDEIEDDNSEVRDKSNQAWNTLKDIYVSVITDINKKSASNDWQYLSFYLESLNDISVEEIQNVLIELRVFWEKSKDYNLRYAIKQKYNELELKLLKIGDF